MKNDKLLFRNPAAVLFLGAAPALGASTDVRAALAMSVAVLVVLLCSSLLLGLIRKLLPREAFLAAAMLVVAGFASAAQLLLQAFVPSVYEMLGFYAAILAVDLLLFAGAECAEEQGLGKALVNALLSGLIFTVFVLLLAGIRELFGSASFAGQSVEALKNIRINVLTQASGGLIVFAILLAVVNALCPAALSLDRLSSLAVGCEEKEEEEA